MNFWTILLAIFVLGVLITVHEFGHYISARLMKMNVYEFAIGMGPKIYSRQGKHTLFSLRAIPMGGYCLYDKEETLLSGSSEFNTHPVWKRMIAIFSGPAMNALLAVVLVFFLLAAVGLPETVSKVAGVTEGSPAAQAGLMVDDEVIAIDENPVNGDAERLRQLMQDAGGNTMAVQIERDGVLLTLSIKPYHDTAENRWMVGIQLGQENRKVGVSEAVPAAFRTTWMIVSDTVRGLVSLIFKGQGASQVVGPVGITSIMATAVTQPNGLANLLLLVAAISVNLCVVNLIPFPALDGSKIVLLLVEGVRRKPIPMAKEGIIQAIGMGVFILLFVFLVVYDIIRLAGGGIG